jgi:MFS family permease
LDWYPWIVAVHVIGAFAFVLAHGVSMIAAFQLRGERERARVTALLDLSSSSLMVVYIGLLVLLAGGIAAGFVGDHWGRLWIWTSLGLLIGIAVFMYVVATPYYARLRKAVGQKAYGDKKDAPPPEPVGEAELAALLATPRAHILAGVGGLGLAAIVWLMVLKPF